MRRVDPASLLERGRKKAEAQILESVRTRYFPEVWYALENWFQLLKGRRVLEVGYGVGMVTAALARSGWDVTCVDPSSKALDELRGRLAKASLKATFELADPDKLPFPDASFDAAVSINTLELAVSAAEAAREVGRVLVPGGRAVIATFNKLSPWGLPAIARAIRPGDPGRGARFLAKDDFVRMLKATGLTVEDVKERAAYLPGTGRVKLRLPIAGAFVALVSKAPPKAKRVE